MSNEAPIAVVAGVSLGSYRRSDWKPARSGWVIQVLPGQEHGHGNLMHIWQRVLRYGDEHADRVDAGVHFLLAHDREDERPAFRRELRGRSFRAVWLPKVLSTQYGSTDFREAIDDLLEFEEQWSQRLRPDLNSPLLLPESAFEADPNVRDTWIRAHNVVVDHDNMDAVDVPSGDSSAFTGRARAGWTRANCFSIRAHRTASTACLLGGGRNLAFDCRKGFIST